MFDHSFCMQLLETKTTDRKQTLLHYIGNVVREKYPAVITFHNELHYIEKAAAGRTICTVYLSYNAVVVVLLFCHRYRFSRCSTISHYSGENTDEY